MFTIFGFSIMFGLILIDSEVPHRLLFGKSNHSSEAVFQIPQTNFEIVLERRPAHPFLAEYERTIILRVDGEEILNQEASFDTGGYSRMNIYQISSTEYFLSGDINDKYELDVSKQKLNSNLSAEKPLIAKFIGAFDVDEKRKWRFIPASERKEQKSKLSNQARAEYLPNN